MRHIQHRVAFAVDCHCRSMQEEDRYRYRIRILERQGGRAVVPGAGRGGRAARRRAGHCCC